MRLERPSFKCSFYLVSLIFSVLLSGCASPAAAVPIDPSPTWPGPTPTYKVYAAPTRTPISVEIVRQIIAQNPTYLASVHLASGLECTSCHESIPPASVPKTDTCLGCHGGTYDSVAALTSGAMNPHKSHLGELPCMHCHFGHQPLNNQCKNCKHGD